MPSSQIDALLRPYLAGLRTVVDETPPHCDIGRGLFLPDSVTYVRPGPGDGPLDRSTIAVALLGPDRAEHGDPSVATSVIARLEPGARLLLLFGWDLIELPYHRSLDDLIRHRCQVLQVERVDLGAVRAAAIIERVDALRAPAGESKRSGDDAPDRTDDQLAMGLAFANEAAFLAAADQQLRIAVRDDSTSVDQQRLDSVRRQTAAQLRDRDREIDRLNAKIAGYDSSGAVRLGRTLVRAGRSPRALVRLPMDLYGIWRTRRR